VQCGRQGRWLVTCGATLPWSEAWNGAASGATPRDTPPGSPSLPSAPPPSPTSSSPGLVDGAAGSGRRSVQVGSDRDLAGRRVPEEDRRARKEAAGSTEPVPRVGSG
jgi:hypothetical protein